MRDSWRQRRPERLISRVIKEIPRGRGEYNQNGKGGGGQTGKGVWVGRKCTAATGGVLRR